MNGGARRLLVAASAALAALVQQRPAAAETIDWKGRTWEVTSGGMAGVCEGSASNVSVDDEGYLHLRISEAGGKWTAAELFSTDVLGFGTYQWHLDGPIDTYDEQVVVGLFPYGPAAGIGDDGTNEIDIEFSRWGQASGPNGDFTNYPASGTTIGEHTYTFSLGGSTLSTARLVWSSTGIVSSLSSGLQPVGSGSGLIEGFGYAPRNPSMNIPQQALPLGINLWCFEAPPSNGDPVELVIRDFSFVPEAAVSDAGAGGSGSSGAGGVAGRGRQAGRGGSESAGGASVVGGRGGALAGSGGSSEGGRTGLDGSSSVGGGHTSSMTAGSAGEGATGAVGHASTDASCALSRLGPSGEAWWLLALAALVLRCRGSLHRNTSSPPPPSRQSSPS